MVLRFLSDGKVDQDLINLIENFFAFLPYICHADTHCFCLPHSLDCILKFLNKFRRPRKLCNARLGVGSLFETFLDFFFLFLGSKNTVKAVSGDSLEFEKIMANIRTLPKKFNNSDTTKRNFS